MQNKLLYLLFLPLLAATPQSANEPELIGEFVTIRHSMVTVETFNDLLAPDAKSLPIPFAQTLTKAKAKVPSLRDLPLAGNILRLSPTRPIDVLPTTLPTDPDAGRLVLLLEIDLRGRNTPPGSAKLLADAVVDVLRDRLLSMQNKEITDDQDEITLQTNSALELQKDIEQTKKSLVAATTQLSATGLHPDAAPSELNTARSTLEIERLKTELDLAGLKARRDALQEAIAQQADKARDAQKDDPTLKALSKAVDAGKANLNFVTAGYSQGVATSAEKTKAELDLLNAQAALAEHQNAAGGSAEAMAHWNQQLVDASIEQREKEARLKAANDRIEYFGSALIALHDHQLLNNKLKKISDDLARAQSNINSYTQNMNYFRNSPPQITITPASPPDRIER